MLGFASGATEVLVCTTIIESGLDIPNANTIIIDRADALGLASSTSSAVESVGPAAAPTPTCCTAGARSSRTSPASGCKPSSTHRNWAPASRSPSPTSRYAARATSSGPSNTATWQPSVSTSTPGCWPRRSRSRRQTSKAGLPWSNGRARSSTCRWTPTCRTPTSPKPPRSSSCTGVSAGSGLPASWPRSARNSPTGSVRCHRRSCACSR